MLDDYANIFFFFDIKTSIMGLNNLDNLKMESG